MLSGWRLKIQSLFQSRFFMPVVWSFLLVWFFVLGSALHLPEVLDRVETSLLDMRLKARALTLTPSKDIIVVALDRRSYEYGLNHPEIGIKSKVLPRAQLARVVDYLNEAGAGALLMDVYFDTSQSPEDDEALEAAIRRGKNVYLAAQAEFPLDKFRHQMRLDDPSGELNAMQAFTYYRVFPWLDGQNRLFGMMPQGCLSGYASAGMGPYFDINQTLRQPDGLAELYWQGQCRSSRFAPVVATRPGHVPEFVQAQGLGNLLDAFSRHHCLETQYKSAFLREPQFLSILANRHAPITVRGRHPETLSFCKISPLRSNFLEAARGVGMVSVAYDQDTVFRRLPLVYESYRGNFYTYLGFAPVLDMLERPARLEENRLYLDNRTVPLTDDRHMLIHWRNPALLAQDIYREVGWTIPTEQLREISFNKGNRELGYGHLYRIVSVVDVLKKLENPDDPDTPSLYRVYGQPKSGELSFKDKIIIYGNTMEDVHRTAISDRTYGPEIVASVTDMLLNDTRFARPAPLWVVGLFGLLVCGALVYSQLRIDRLWVGFFAGLLLVVLYWIVNFVSFIKWAVLMPLAIPTLLFGVTMMASTVYRYYIHDREKRQLTNVFSKYVSPQVMDRILEDPEAGLENLEGVEKNLTVLFADLRGFTHRFNEEDPRRMVRQLNEFFTAMTRIILKHQGTYDKFMGDAIMAFFGAPVDMPNHAEKACAAAVEMLEELDRMNLKWQEQGIPPLDLGVGLSSGEMIVGNFGSEDLMNFTVMGTAVNLGARLEAITRKVDFPVVISERTMQAASKRILVRDLGRHEIKGFSDPVQIYGLEAMRPAPDEISG